MNSKFNNIKKNIEIIISAENEINSVLDLQTKNLYSILNDINIEYDIINEAEYIMNSMSWKGRFSNIFNKFFNLNSNSSNDLRSNKELKDIYSNVTKLKNINIVINNKLYKHREYLDIILNKKCKLDYKTDKINKKISKYL